MNRYYEPLETPDVSGRIYMFGVSGYMGLYFENPEPFPGQLYDVVIRSYSTLAGTGRDVTGQSAKDASFDQYDQARIYFNPGGKSMAHADFLEENSRDAIKIYQQTVLLRQEAALRKVAHDDLMSMFEDMVLIKQYTQRLESDFDVTISGTPDVIDGDSIDARTKDGKKLKWSNSQGLWADDDGNTYEKNEAVLSLVTSHHIDGGYSYRWQDLRISDTGYLSAIVSANDDVLTMFKENKERLTHNKADSLNMDDIKFYSVLGQEIVLQEVNADMDKQSAQVLTEIQRLEDMWADFYNLKYKYETVDLYDLLYLEYNANNVTEKYSYSFEDDTLVVH